MLAKANPVRPGSLSAETKANYVRDFFTGRSEGQKVGWLAAPFGAQRPIRRRRQRKPHFSPSVLLIFL